MSLGTLFCYLSRIYNELTYNRIETQLATLKVSNYRRADMADGPNPNVSLVAIIMTTHSLGCNAMHM